MKSLSSLILCTAHALLAIAFTSPAASAQCFGPDNLDVGPCCGIAQENLPSFPDVVMPGLGICWDKCQPVQKLEMRVEWPTLTQTACGQYSTPLLVTDSTTGIPTLSGTMVLDYTRTWLELDPTTGQPQQVWRFVAKADLSVATPGVVPPCPTPKCNIPLGTAQTSFFYGYVDYMFCQPGTPTQNALVLYHACDRFMHMPGLSDFPGVFHPAESYAIVAPHSTLQPFTPANMIAPGGPLLAEATRNVVGALPPLCIVEDRVVAGDMKVLGAGCLCTMKKNPKAQTLRKFSGVTACTNAAGIPGSWVVLNIAFPTLPWFNLVTTSIGTWGSPAVYPGIERAWVDEGLFATSDACTGDYVEIKYGATTDRGWDVLSPIHVGSFTDMADNWSAPISGPFVPPILGRIRPTDHLVYVNTP